MRRSVVDAERPRRGGLILEGELCSGGELVLGTKADADGLSPRAVFKVLARERLVAMVVSSREPNRPRFAASRRDIEFIAHESSGSSSMLVVRSSSMGVA